MAERIVATGKTDKIPMDMSLFIDPRFKGAAPTGRLWVKEGVFKANVTQVDVNATQLRQMAKRMVEAATLLEGGWKG
jgi:hypothetical protein